MKRAYSGQLHGKSLQRNFASFNVIKDLINIYCAFRSIVRQIKKVIKCIDPSSVLWERLTYLCLGNAADADMLKLCQLLVDNVQSNVQYQMLTRIPSLDVNAETEKFREAHDIGNLVIEVCSDCTCLITRKMEMLL